MASLKKSTIVRIKNQASRAFFRYGEYLAPRRTGAAFHDLWFAAPPRMGDLPLPEGGEAFTVVSQGAVIHGHVWGEGPTVYLMHGWGGRGSQFGPLVGPLVATGRRVVLFDAPAHGDSEPGPLGPRHADGVEFAKALDAVAARFGAAEAVIAHSMGTITTFLELRFGWLGAERLVFLAPMVEAESLIGAFQAALGFGPRTRRAFEDHLVRTVGFPVSDFDARVQARHVEPLPTLVIADRDDPQTPYADAVDFASSIDAEFVGTEGLGHRRILRDPAVISRVVAFVAGHKAGLEVAG